MGLVAMLGPSCSKDEEPAKGLIGESCAARTDCSSGLACVNEQCAIDNYTRYITDPSKKRCESVQCLDREDCCTLLSPNECESLKSGCDSGFTWDCDQYDMSCRCDAECTDNACVYQCDTDSDCRTGGLPRCNDGTCVACICDDDCGTEGKCRDNTCQTSCDADIQCKAFHVCEEGVCVKSGCKSDRECIAHIGSVLASCEGGLCRMRCSHDVECQTYVTVPTGAEPLDPSDWQPTGISACISGFCEELGCQTNNECRAWMMTSDQLVECREVKPASIDLKALPPSSCDEQGAAGAAGSPGTGGTGGTGGYYTGGTTGVVCENTCNAYTYNGVCEDGGPGAS